MSAPKTAAELEALKSGAPLLALYLKSETCGPCQAVLPIAERAFGAAPWRLAVVDQGQAPEIFGQLLVFAVPTLILYIEGQELRRFSRFIPEGELLAAKARAEDLIAAPPV